MVTMHYLRRTQIKGINSKLYFLLFTKKMCAMDDLNH